MRGVLNLILLCTALAIPNSGFADQDPEDVTLHIRTVKAQGHVARGAASQDEFAVDERLTDLRTKLEHVPYHNFRLLSARQIPVSLLRKTTIHIDNGQVLNVRLLYANAERVGMWVRWTDRDGMELLDTRMHFKCDEAMITGTDSSADSAVILALGVERK